MPCIGIVYTQIYTLYIKNFPYSCNTLSLVSVHGGFMYTTTAKRGNHKKYIHEKSFLLSRLRVMTRLLDPLSVLFKSCVPVTDYLLPA